jgi:hypothetical protein
VLFSFFAVVIVAGFLASFLWPSDASLPMTRSVNAGSKYTLMSYRAPHFISVTKGGRVLDQTLVASAPADAEYLARFWLVYIPGEDRFLALNYKDPRGCTIPWRPDFSFTDPRTDVASKGWFRDPCGGSTYDIEGHRVFGPSPRDLDQYPVVIAGNNVIVKVGNGVLIKGRRYDGTFSYPPYAPPAP